MLFSKTIVTVKQKIDDTDQGINERCSQFRKIILSTRMEIKKKEIKIQDIH